VAAIFEAAALGLKGIAVSTEPKAISVAWEELDRVWEYFCKHDLLNKHSIYNVNIPMDACAICITRQGGPYYSDEFTLENSMVTPHGIDVFEACGCEDVDTDCVLRCGMISITPMTNQRANMPLYEELRKLNG
jgi:broad specificity polyphosphatase/5'/3'-nucleotidase SurE